MVRTFWTGVAGVVVVFSTYVSAMFHGNTEKKDSKSVSETRSHATT